MDGAPSRSRDGYVGSSTTTSVQRKSAASYTCRFMLTCDNPMTHSADRPYHLRKVLRVKAEGKGILLNPLFNKGTAHNSGERDRLGLRGLLPSQVMTFEGQIERVMQAFYKEKDPFRKYATKITPPAMPITAIAKATFLTHCFGLR